MRQAIRGLVWGILALCTLTACTDVGTGVSRAIQPEELAIVVNTADPLSVRIGEYYRDRRNIPERNWIEIELPSRTRISPSEFRKIQRQVERQTPPNVQAYALTWAEPYRVGCMSITSAFALGFDQKYCSEGCNATAPSPYFNQESSKPYRDFGVRPTMAIAATSFSKARALIDRGIRSDYDRPKGTAYLLSTSDTARNARAADYAAALTAAVPDFAVEQIQADKLENKRDVMFYFTGLMQVEGLRSNRFLPGAVGDHLTSFGGMLTDSSQMSSLRWLEAGATGSYGTVAEPCNYPQKFPHPAVLLNHYRRGDTLIEAYWKSVAWPGQGLFIGEPLAKPFR